MSTTTVLTHERAVTAAESIRVPPTSLPAVPDLLPPTNSSPKSHPALPPPSLSRFIELFDLAGSSHTTTQAESSGRGVIVYVPHPRTRALVPVWKQPSLPESSSRPHDYHPGMHSPTPLLSPSARRYSSPGNLAPSGSAIPRRSESPILLRPHSPTRSHTQLEPRPQIVPLETTVDVAARPPAPVNGQARWPSHAVNAPSNHQVCAPAPRTTSPVTIPQKKRFSLNLVDRIPSTTSKSPPIGSSSTSSQDPDNIMSEKQSHRNSFYRALHFFSPFSDAATASSPTSPSSSRPSSAASRGAGIRTKSSVQSLSSDEVKQPPTRRPATITKDEAEYNVPSPVRRSGSREPRTGTASHPGTTSLSIPNGVIHPPLYSSPSGPRSAAVSKPSIARPHLPIRSGTAPMPQTPTGASITRRSNRPSSRPASLHLPTPTILGTSTTPRGAEAGVVRRQTEGDRPRARPRKLTRSSDMEAREEREDHPRATKQRPKSFVGRLFALPE